MAICFCHPVLNHYEDRVRGFYEVLSHGISIGAKLLAIRRGVEFVELTCKAARREVLEKQLTSNKAIGIFVFAGHAGAGGFHATGHRSEVCLDEHNAYLFAGKKVYLVCCCAANGLARAIVKAGALMCLSFTDKVYLMARKQEPVVVRCLVAGIEAMLEHLDADSVHSHVWRKHERCVRRIMDCYWDDEDWLLAAAAIDWNMEHFAVVTEDRTRKGVSIVPKIGNTPGNLTKRELDAAIERLEAWVKRAGETATAPGLVTGDDENLTPAAILRILKERRRGKDWGHEDLPERYLMLLARRETAAPET